MIPQWVRDLVASSVYGVERLARAAAERIAIVYALVVSVGLALRTGWSHLLVGFYYWRDRITNLVREYYLTLWYIINVRIPTVVSNAIEGATRYLVAAIVDAANKAAHALELLGRWALDNINRVIDNIIKLSAWALREVNQILDTLGRVALLVFTLLTDPRRMAKWVLGALVTELIQFVDDHADAILESIRKRGIAYAGRIAARIEEVLVRML